MPVELTDAELRDALALFGEWDGEGAQGARAALECMGWEDGSFLLRRYDVQNFLWYTLPRKFLIALDQKREVAAALGLVLERLGARAASYAELCRSPQTEELLRAWEAEDPAAWDRFRELLAQSGIEPPDTDLLAWGAVMGLEEARVREQVATALEETIEDGRLIPGTRGARRRQAEIADSALREPWEGDGRQSRLEAVHSERLERWLEPGRARGSAERRAILEAVAPLLAAPSPIDSEAAATALAPALWLLERAGEGIALTQSGALNRAFVRELVERWPVWWEAEPFGPPNREGEVVLLCELHRLARDLGLLRRKGRRVLLTARGRALVADPAALLGALSTELLAGEGFQAACAELAVALILDGAPVDYSQALAERVQPAIVAEGWQAGGEAPAARDVSWAIADFLRPAEAIGVFECGEAVSRFSPDPLVLTEAGRAGLIAGLRARALAPSGCP